MTTDDFTEAARAEAEDQCGNDIDAEHFLAGVEWARDHLAQQKPTDAEVEAAAVVIWESYDLLDRAAIRAALSAARRDEEKR